jgi:murein DD-endopeptidase MepM/ murein hydrolase activator NlpD
MQIHIRKEKVGHSIDFIAIDSKDINKKLLIVLDSSIYKDMYDKTQNRTLGGNLVSVFGKSMFKTMQKGDKIAINYTQTIKDGKLLGTPTIISAMVEVNKKPYFRFRNPHDEQYYNKKAQSASNFFLKIPLRYARVSSPFSYRRFHPILKKYRAHHGIDYAAPRGRQIYASGDGRVVFKGSKGGYGNTIIIQHKHNYRTLYAHMRAYKKGIKRGQTVSQGALIGYVGSTGRSTGPHLHFGLYSGSKAINPNRVVRKALKTKLKGKDKKLFDKFAHLQLDILQTISSNNPIYEPYKNTNNSCERGSL